MKDGPINLDAPEFRKIAAEHGETAALDAAKLASISFLSQDERANLPSASSAHRYAQCPGSYMLEQTVPVPPTSADATLGNRVHAILAGEPVADVTDEERELAGRCDQELSALLNEWAGPGETADRLTFVREERLWAFDGLGKAWSGKPDLVAIDRQLKRGLVVDYKTGRGDVDLAAGNHQLRALAVLVADQYDLDHVTVAIVQPLAGRPSTCIYSPDDLERARLEVQQVMRAARQPGQPRVPSVAACKYCRAKEVCPEARAVVEVIPSVVTRDGREIAMSPERIAAFLEAAQIAEGVIESIRAKAKRMLEEAPGSVPGWALKPGATREKIREIQTVFSRFLGMGGTQEQFMPAVSLTKTAFKDAVRAATGHKGKSLDATVAQILEGCTEASTAAPSLVREKGDA